MNTTLRPGDSITTATQWDALPMGTTYVDHDGWTGTKSANYTPGEPVAVDVRNADGEFVGTFYCPWTYGAEIVSFPEVEDESTEAPERPLVHFDDEKAGRDRSKARDAARLAVSTANKGAETNSILSEAAAGQSVDAYALNAAVLDAMRSATTRLGQSTGRRAMAKQFAHLGHIVQAVLENHADNLPAYAEGERSRAVAEAKVALREAKTEIDRLVAVIDERAIDYVKAGDTIATLRAEIDHSIEVNQSLTRDLTTLKQAASDERRRLCEEIDYEKGRVADLIREKTSEELRSETLQATLTYALTLLPVEERCMVEGYEAGFSKGRSNRADA